MPEAEEISGLRMRRNPAVKCTGPGHANGRRAGTVELTGHVNQFHEHCKFHLLALQHWRSVGWLGFAPLIFIFAIFYFLLIMPQQRRQKKWQQMLNELKTGDKVVTSGGIARDHHRAAR